MIVKLQRYGLISSLIEFWRFFIITCESKKSLNLPTQSGHFRYGKSYLSNLYFVLQDGIRINVTTLNNSGGVSKEQVVLNITYESGQVYVNDLPVNSGVTRISRQTLIGEYFCIVSNITLSLIILNAF